MTTASALLEVFKTLPPRSKKEFVHLLAEENQNANLFIKSLERGLKEVKAVESGEKKGKTLKEILNGNWGNLYLRIPTFMCVLYRVIKWDN